jgi:hypothetical protein
MAEFHRIKVLIRVLVGGRGSGKTTGIAVEAMGHCFHNAGAKVYILRKTQDSNQDTTLDTFEQVFAQSGSAYQDTGLSLFKRIEGGKFFRLPSRKAVELFNIFRQTNPNKAQTDKWLESVGSRYCSWICFAGVPNENLRATRFRGYECSMLIFVEADQLAKEDLDMALACLRWKGADPANCDAKGFIMDTCVILDTNPPSPSHWIAKMEERAIKEADKTIKFWHIPTHENKSNLPTGYVEMLERTYADNLAMYQRMLLGQYADAFDGSPVLYAFKQGHAFPELGWPEGAYLVRGWDFGTTHSVIWAAYWSDGTDEYWWDLFEYFAEQSDVERQCKATLEITEKVFPFWNDRDICSGVKDFCDVAGTARTDKGRSVDTLHSYGIYPGYSRMLLQDSLTLYNRLLEKKDRWGNFCYRIDKTCCPRLYVGSMGGYRYPTEGEPGYGSDEPLKGPRGGNFDHLVDAARYAKINALRIIKAEFEGRRGVVGKWGAAGKNYNKARRYY